MLAAIVMLTEPEEEFMVGGRVTQGDLGQVKSPLAFETPFCPQQNVNTWYQGEK